jgi:hypothetical protein
MVNPPPAKRLRSGSLLVLGLIAVFAVGWFVYRVTIPPAWLRDFGSEIALRATPDPNAGPPEDARMETPRGLADHPYICAANAIHVPWDRLVFVESGQELRTQPALADAKWPPGLLDRFADELKRDERYQLVALVKDNAVVDAQLFYTFWAKLDAVATDDGYSPASAIFTAAVKDGTYILSPAPDAPADACVR